MSTNFIIGNKTKFFFTVMPDELLALPEVVPPVDVPITVSEAIEIAEVELTVGALTGPIPAGTPIRLTVNGGATPADRLTVYTTQHAKTGDNVLEIEPAQKALTTGAIGTYTAKLLLIGGTTSSKQIQNQNVESKIYGDKLTYTTGAITSATWMVDYTANVLPSDDGNHRVEYAAVHAVEGVHGYLWLEQPAPVGYAKGKVIEGLVQLENINDTMPADNIVTFTTKFLGRGTPKTTPISLT